MRNPTDAVNEALRQHREAREAFITQARRVFHGERDPTDEEIDGLAMYALKAAAAKKAAQIIAERLERSGEAN